MTPPVKIDELMREWAKDAAIDDIDTQKTMAKIPVLHSKYLNIMTHHKLVAAKLKSNYDKTRYFQSEYLQGNYNNPDDLALYNISPCLNTVSKMNIDAVLAANSELNDILLKKIVNEEIVSYCQMVLKELSNRTWQCKSIIDYNRMLAGG